MKEATEITDVTPMFPTGLTEEFVRTACEKQKPMKATFVAGEKCKCPACELPTGYLNDYCSFCGQAMDWDIDWEEE